MLSTASPVLDSFESTLTVLRTLPTDITVLHGWDEATLLTATRLHAEATRVLASAGAALAGELAHRSRPELGSEGLARRTGHRTVENLLKITTGGTKEQVLTAVRTGTLLTEIANEGLVDSATGEVFAPTQPWLRVVAVAVSSGGVSPSAAQSIANGLGKPNSSVTEAQLATAAVALVAAAITGVDADRLWRDARELRNELDVAGVKLREAEAHALRGLTHHPLPGGGGVASIRMNPENYATFVDYYDRMTSPKRGGVRFVDKTRRAQAEAIRDDDRTPAQLAFDGFFTLLGLGANTDDSVMLGTGAAIIRVTVPEKALTTGAGFGRLDGQPDPLSIDTVKRLICEGMTLQIGFDPFGNTRNDTKTITRDGKTFGENPARDKAEARLFNKRQREILAAKFGGCMDPDCDRPPSWTEAHHIHHWHRDNGRTVTGNGILLCKYHHLKYHNEGYEIFLDGQGGYWKIPPTTIDPTQTPIRMPLKTRNLHDLWAS